MTSPSQAGHFCAISVAALLAGASTQAAPVDGTGEWRGPMQYQFAEGGQRDPAAHVIAPVVLELNGEGVVRGISSEAGCKFLGLARLMTPAASVWTIDVTASGCSDARFNRRYSGTLAVYSKPPAVLTLTSNHTGLFRKQSSAQLSANLRR